MNTPGSQPMDSQPTVPDSPYDGSLDDPTPWFRVSWAAASAAAAVVAVGMTVLLVTRIVQVNPSASVTETATLAVRQASIPRGLGDPAEPELIPAVRTIDVYRGYGAWVDAFDYSPPYAGVSPPVTPEDLDQMAADGVDTIYLQAARLSSRSPNGLEDRWLISEFLIGAHERGMAVVAWYLPKWTADGRDLDRIRLLDSFEVLGHRFDGVAVDIEWTNDGLTPEKRSDRLVALSQLASDSVDGPLGAIVLPPVLIDVVNTAFWPDFPWRELAPLYDVWLPMSYWSVRSGDLRDGYTYHKESTRRLREHLGDDAALVHGIGGIGGAHPTDMTARGAAHEPLATPEEIRDFLRALDDTDSIGGSIYDWNTLTPTVRAELAAHFSTSKTSDIDSETSDIDSG